MLIIRAFADFRVFSYALERKSKFCRCLLSFATSRSAPGCEGEGYGEAARESDSASNNYMSSSPHSPLPHQLLECLISLTAMTKPFAIGRSSRLNGRRSLVAKDPSEGDEPDL